MPAIDHPQRPYWILFFAHIWSSLGVGVSILAVWVVGILPALIAKPKMEEPWVLVERPGGTKKKTTDEEDCTSLSLSSPQSPSPSPVGAALPHPVSPRRVSFRVPPPPVRLPSVTDAQLISFAAASTASSPDSIHSPSAFFSPNSPFEDNQDASPPLRQSRHLSHRLLKPFLAKRKDSTTTCDSEPESSVVQNKGGISFWHKPRRSRLNEYESNKPSISFFQRRISLTKSSRTPSPSPSSARSPLKNSIPFTHLTRKSEWKRQSAPLPIRHRTEPYGAPYFATPPLPLAPDVFNSEEPRISTESVPVRGRQALRQHMTTSYTRRPIVKRRSASTSRAMTSIQL